MSEAPSCDSCRFYWHKDVPQCRRYAPRPRYTAADHRDKIWLGESDTSKDLLSDQPVWPYVDPDDWCGEFQEQ
jgi:hypothetical protein